MASILQKGNEEPRMIKRKLVLSFGVVLFLSPIVSSETTAWVF